jgi:hypothetical protein
MRVPGHGHTNTGDRRGQAAAGPGPRHPPLLPAARGSASTIGHTAGQQLAKTRGHAIWGTRNEQALVTGGLALSCLSISALQAATQP